MCCPYGVSTRGSLIIKITKGGALSLGSMACAALWAYQAFKNVPKSPLDLVKKGVEWAGGLACGSVKVADAAFAMYDLIKGAMDLADYDSHQSEIDSQSQYCNAKSTSGVNIGNRPVLLSTLNNVTWVSAAYDREVSDAIREVEPLLRRLAFFQHIAPLGRHGVDRASCALSSALFDSPLETSLRPPIAYADGLASGTVGDRGRAANTRHSVLE